MGANRVIKFRAWDKHAKSMHNLSSMLFYCDPMEIDHDGNMGEHKSVEHFELMQFTGLTDKNGTEIYEGDIVALDHGDTKWVSALEVIHLNGSFQFKQKDLPFPCGFVTYAEQCCNMGLLDHHANLGGIIKIIGNIHENPELLNN